MYFYDKDEALKRMIAFALLMGAKEEILSKSPDYIIEKYDECVHTQLPSSLLDDVNTEILNRYLKKWAN